MNSTEARNALLRGSPGEQLQAARWLAINAGSADTTAVQEALARDPDHWVLSALSDALGRAGSRPAHALGKTALTDDDDDPELAIADAYARGLRDTTSTLVHELRRFLGFAKLSAGADLATYGTSRTKHDLDRLSFLLDAIERLGKVSEVGVLEEFDLSELLLEAIASESEVFSREIFDRGSRPLLVRGDRRLVELAVRTAIVNACEALRAFEAGSDRPLVVAWGLTDRDAWVAVIDQGPGLPPNLADPFEFAATTKDQGEHLGVGLAIARRAAESLGGSVSLRPGANAGVVFELRWPQD